MTFKPMLAATLKDTSVLRFPLLASPKLDGIRCVIHKGKVLSRSLKPIRNKYIQSQLCRHPDMDGELIVGLPYHGNVLARTMSGVMSAEGTPDFKFFAFDTLHDLTLPFHKRLDAVPGTLQFVVPVQHTLLSSLPELTAYEYTMLERGYEGVMLRDPNAAYKCGRASPSEGSLWKLKQFTDGELLVEAVREGEMNINYPTYDALGHTVRSKHQAGMVPNGKVGTLIGRDLKTNHLLEVSPGKMTRDVRIRLWQHPNEVVGSIIKYQFFGYGNIDAPRFATFQAFRDKDDMGE